MSEPSRGWGWLGRQRKAHFWAPTQKPGTAATLCGQYTTSNVPAIGWKQLPLVPFENVNLNCVECAAALERAAKAAAKAGGNSFQKVEKKT